MVDLLLFWFHTFIGQLDRANMEHRRWNADRLLSGWTYGKDRDDELKIHDNLVDWEDLPDGIKNKDIETINNIPKILKEFKIRICKSKDNDC